VSKRTITRWYIDAWVVWFVALVAAVAISSAPHGATAPAGLTVAYVVMALAGMVTFVMWVAALVKLARQGATVTLVAVLLLQLMGLGIVGMLLYAVVGQDESSGYVIRPSVT
jgi:hypothetical protein